MNKYRPFLERLYSLSLCMIAISIPFGLRASNIALGVAGVSWLGLVVIGQRLGFSLVQKLGFVMGGLIVTTALLSDNLPKAISILEPRLTWIAFPLLFGFNSLVNRRNIDLILKVFTTSITMAAILSLLIGFIHYFNFNTWIHLNEFHQGEEHFLKYNLLAGYLGRSPLYLGYYVGLAIILLLFTNRTETSQITFSPLLRVSQLVLLSSYLILLGSLSAIVATFFAFIPFGLHRIFSRSSPSKARKFLVGLTILVFVVLSVQLFEKKVGSGSEIFAYSELMKPSDPRWNALNIRIAKWESTLDLVADNWLFGTGLSEMQTNLNSYYLKNRFIAGYYSQFNPHNQYLQILATFGVMGFGIYVLWLYVTTRVAIKRRDLSLIGVLVILLVSSLFESVLARNEGTMFFLFFIFLLASRDQTNKADVKVDLMKRPDKKGRINLMGLDVDVLTVSQTTEYIAHCISSKRQIQHSFVNANSYYVFERQPIIGDMINNSDLVSADGQAVVWASRILGHPLPERVSGLDLMESLLAWVSTSSEKVYLLGAEPEIVEAVAEKYVTQYGDIVAGYHHGFFKEEEEEDVVQTINESGASVLLMAVPSPKKEVFLGTHKNEMPKVYLLMGVGGSFDVIAGKVNRAPRWMQDNGFEWLYRLLKEPRRLWKRYLFGNLSFIWRVIIYRFRKS